MNMTAVFVEYRISMAFLLIFIYVFSVKRYKTWKTIGIMTCCYCIIAGIEYVEYFIKGMTSNSIPVTILETLFVQGTCMLIHEKRDFKALFVGITSAAYVAFGNVFWQIADAWCGNWGVIFAVQISAHLILLFILVAGVRDMFLKKLVYGTRSWQMLCLIPSLFYIITYGLTVWPLNLYEYPEAFPIILAVLVLMVLEYFFFVILLKDREHVDEMRLNQEHLEVYAQRVEQELDDMIKREEEIALLRHDSRHYIKLLYGYVEDKNEEKIKEILLQTDQKLSETKPDRYCENLSVNVVASYCMDLARKHDVQLYLDLKVPVKLKCSESEYATVVSNLMENAIQAATMVKDTKKRTVQVKVQKIKEQLILEITNTYDTNSSSGVVTKDDRISLYDRTIHGLGMKSVAAFAEKYDAVFDYHTDHEKFYVKLLVF